MNGKRERIAFCIGNEVGGPAVTAAGYSDVAVEIVRLARRFGISVLQNDIVASQLWEELSRDVLEEGVGPPGGLYRN